MKDIIFGQIIACFIICVYHIIFNFENCIFPKYTGNFIYDTRYTLVVLFFSCIGLILSIIYRKLYTKQ